MSKLKTIEEVLRTLQQHAIDTVLANLDYAKVKRQDAIHEPNLQTALAVLSTIVGDIIPTNTSVPKGRLTTAGEQVRYRALGYNQAIKEARAKAKEYGIDLGPPHQQGKN